MKRILSFLLVSAILLPNAYAQSDDISTKIDAIKAKNDILISRASANLDNLVNRVWNDKDAAYTLAKKLSVVKQKINDLSSEDAFFSIITPTEQKQKACQSDLGKVWKVAAVKDVYQLMKELSLMPCLKGDTNSILSNQKLPKILLYADLGRVINEKIEKIHVPLNDYVLWQFDKISIAHCQDDGCESIDNLSQIWSTDQGFTSSLKFTKKPNDSQINIEIYQDHSQFGCHFFPRAMGDPVFELSAATESRDRIVSSLTEDGHFTQKNIAENNTINLEISTDQRAMTERKWFITFPWIPTPEMLLTMKNIDTNQNEQYTPISNYRILTSGGTNAFVFVAKMIDNNTIDNQWVMICSRYDEM